MELRELIPQKNKPLFSLDVDPKNFDGIIIVCIGEFPIGYIVYKDGVWIESSTIDCTISNYSNKDLNNLIENMLEEDSEKTFKVIEF